MKQEAKNYIKRFMLRGLMFGGFGPVICAIVFLILSFTIEGFSLTGTQVFLAIISTYLLAFIQAGASIFNQIEEWSLIKSLSIHLITLYCAYVLCYLVNSWIPFDPMIILIFSIIFIFTYLIIYFSVLLAIKASAKRMNQKLN